MKVEIWFDFLDPRVYIGKRRFEKALALFPHRDEVEVRWRSYETNPAGGPRAYYGGYAEHLVAIWGLTPEQAAARNRQYAEIGEDEGLVYRLDRAWYGSTFDAHRLVQLAADRGIQDAVVERLLVAYVTECEILDDADTLVGLGAQAGLDAAEARDALASDRYADAVRADRRQAHTIGIHEVPSFVFGPRDAAFGAYPPPAMLEVLESAWAAQTPSPPTS